MKDTVTPPLVSAAFSLSRRRACQLGLSALFTGLAPNIARAKSHQKRTPQPERFLDLYNTHTDERLKAVYWADGNYIPEVLSHMNQLLRDHRTDEVTSIAPALLDFLHAIGQRVEARYPFHIVSGYRSPATNASLRKRSKGVAKHSRHMYGQAIDFYLPGCDLAVVRRAAVKARRGGVGYYPRSNFIHVDTGRVRAWGASQSKRA
ncbi:MAG: hypothetical protein ETSY1_07785 [Candidatus Entotheonella factor]|uniref:Murein endopeptidase K n=1 Tax=Entotheonella factor TaxID=1429438 RepID=W4LTG5_ENTF1|nr:DUF882 domain-containing protein [Candidatus Entotheonella palauensis]ETX01324.1 MAG: hypothetical protein ETSY1_07785 [Candidatus Entotheonella factor]